MAIKIITKQDLEQYIILQQNRRHPLLP